MTFVVAEHTFPEPQTVEQVRQSIRDGGGCNALYGVTHLGTLLGADGRQGVCFYRAPDAEAVRSSSQRLRVPFDRVWSGTLHGEGAEPLTARAPVQAADGAEILVLVSRAFDAPVAFEQVQAREAAQTGRLQAHRVRSLQSLLSFDRRRMLCLYAAPDAEAVRQAQHGTGLPVERATAVTICAP